MTDAGGLAEATALLERWVGGGDGAFSETVAFLSRAPAQPAAPDRDPYGPHHADPEPVAPDECHPAYCEHLKPAAPEPECPYVGRCNSWRCPLHGEPAAPVPDPYPCKLGGECYCVPLCGTPEHKPVTLVSDVLRQVFASELQPAAPVRAPDPATVSRILADPDCAAPEPSGDRTRDEWAAAAVCERDRAESAEAKLAAVREAYERECASYVRLLAEHGDGLQIDATSCLRDLQATVGKALLSHDGGTGEQ